MSLRGGGLPEEHEVAGLFGYVTAEDRERWAKAREANKKPVGTARQMMKSSMEAAHRITQQGIQARLIGEQQAASKGDWDEGHARRTTKITETVDYEDRDTRTRIDEDMEPDF